MLADPQPDKFAAAMLNLLNNPLLCRQLADRAAELAEEKYSLKTYTNTVEKIYRRIESDLAEQAVIKNT